MEHTKEIRLPLGSASGGIRPVEKFILNAPEMRHVTDKPAKVGPIRYTDCSIATKRQRAWAGSRHTRTSGNRVGDFITHPIVVLATWAATISGIGASLAGVI